MEKLLASTVLLASITALDLPTGFEYSENFKLAGKRIILINKLNDELAELGFSRWSLYKVNGPVAPTPPGITVENIHLNNVPCDLVYPTGFKERNDLQSAIVFFHGGGWTFGSKEGSRLLAHLLANMTDSMVILPGYRLAPEHPFPTGYEDSQRALKRFIRLSESFNVDKNKIVLMGDSSGGNLAVALAMKTSVRMVVPLYPILQMNDFTLPSYQQNGHFAFLTKRIMVQLVLTYMGLDQHQDLEPVLSNNLHTSSVDNDTLKTAFRRVDRSLIPDKYKSRPYQLNVSNDVEIPAKFSELKSEILSKISDTRFAPLVASDEELFELPRTHIVTCEFDALRDDGIILYERLKKLGSDVTLQHLEFGLHGQFWFDLPAGEKRIMDELQVITDMINEELTRF